VLINISKQAAQLPKRNSASAVHFVTVWLLSVIN